MDAGQSVSKIDPRQNFPWSAVLRKTAKDGLSQENDALENRMCIPVCSPQVHRSYGGRRHSFNGISIVFVDPIGPPFLAAGKGFEKKLNQYPGNAKYLIDNCFITE